MRSPTVTVADIRAAIAAAGLRGRPLCIHASLRSFGWVHGGAQAVIDGLLAEGCTVLMPTFSADTFAVAPLPHQQPPRNGWNEDEGGDNWPPRSLPLTGPVYSPSSVLIERGMGALPAAVLAMPQRVRGDHPLCSFSAVGPLAHALIAGQAPLRVYAPLEALVEREGAVILMGVGLDKMTLLHLAEVRAERRPFRRWAAGPDGQSMEVEMGGCSNGFGRLEAVVRPVERRMLIGQSFWRIYEASAALPLAAEAIQREPGITHCGAPCRRCDDAVLGGPILSEGAV